MYFIIFQILCHFIIKKVVKSSLNMQEITLFFLWMTFLQLISSYIKFEMNLKRNSFLKFDFHCQVAQTSHPGSTRVY
jgi:hypothetical protein